MGSNSQPPAVTNQLTIAAALLEGEQRLEVAGALRPRRHVELLLESALGLERSELYLRARETVDAGALQRFEALLRRREAGEPVQHIVGWAPFYGQRLYVGSGVFIPRFETEVLVERVIEHFLEDDPREASVEILDLCCGNGAIGVTLAAELPRARITMVDISDTALEYAARNAKALLMGYRTEIVKWDALGEPPDIWRGRFHYIAANPPYIPKGDIPTLPRDVREGEPFETLSDGGDGLSFYRRWAQTLPAIMRPGGRLLVECGDGAAGMVLQTLSASFINLTTVRDLNGVERVVEGQNPGT